MNLPQFIINFAHRKRGICLIMVVLHVVFTASTVYIAALSISIEKEVVLTEISCEGWIFLKRRKLFKRVLSIIISVILSVFLIVIITSVILWSTLFSDQYHIKKLDESDFQNTTAQELRDIFVSHENTANIPQQIIENTVTEIVVGNAAKAFIWTSFGVDEAFNYDRFSNDFYTQLREYASTAANTDELSMNSRELAETCTKEFEDYINSDSYRHIIQVTLRYKRILGNIITYLTMAAVSLILILIVVNKRISKVSKCGIYVFAANSILCLLIPCIVYLSGVLNKTNISLQPYDNLLYHINSGFLNRYFAAFIPAVIMLMLCIAIWINRKSKRRHRNRNTVNEGEKEWIEIIHH